MFQIGLNVFVQSIEHVYNFKQHPINTYVNRYWIIDVLAQIS